MASSNKLQTHKVKRNEAKKRKLEAFLALVRQDSAEPLPRKKKTATTFTENYNALKDELRKYQKKKSPNPMFSLKIDGRQAIVNLDTDSKKSNCTEPLFVEDIHNLLLLSVLGNVSPFPLCWAKLENAQNINKTVFLEIDGLLQSDIIKIQLKDNESHNAFPFIIEVLSSNIPFATDLSTLHQVTDFYDQGKENYSSIFPTDETNGNTEKERSTSKHNISKLHLILSPIQLAMEHYPLPQSVFEQSKSEGYCFSKETYIPVSENSPMFAVDCEMCKTVSGKQEVTRIAIVDENLETIYHTLVKPKEVIIDYITRFSGITEKMLQNVTTTLDDVQNDIRKILPSDAILCGQSLNFDLHSLRIIHPYIIDTSVIYNEYGVRQKKTSLKKLAQIHLKESIQDSKKGHNPVEDSIATMKLVQLKLRNFVEYGDAVLSESFENDENTNEVEGSNNASSVEKSPKSCDSVNPNLNNDFFSNISKFSRKVCLIGSEKSLNNYPETVKANSSLVAKSKVKKVIKASSDSIQHHDLILSHCSVLEQESYSLEDLNDEIQQLYNSFPDKTLFMIFIPGMLNSIEENFRKNYCMITVKTDKPI